MIKEYTYALFLRNPDDGKTQNGTITIKHDGYMSLKDLAQTIYHEKTLETGYTLISMMVVDVSDVEDKSNG